MNIESHRAPGEDAIKLIHDLRTPLMVVKSVVTLFARYWDHLDQDKRRDLLQIALAEISILDRRIGGLAGERPIRLDDDPGRDER